MSRTTRRRAGLVATLALALGVPVSGAVFTAPARAATTLPTGFSEQIVFSGLNHPTKVVFAPDGRVFVAEKRGTIQVFDGVSDTTPTQFADLRTKVHDQEDKGLIGLAVPPNFPSNPSVYVAYTYDAPVGGTAPVFNDACMTPGTGCVVDRWKNSGTISTRPPIATATRISAIIRKLLVSMRS